MRTGQCNHNNNVYCNDDYVSREERSAAAEALGVREGKLAANMEELEQRSNQVMQQTAALAADRLALQVSAAIAFQALLAGCSQPC